MIGRAAANGVLATGGVVKANHVAAGGRLTPAHVPPNGRRAAEHAHEVGVLAAVHPPRSLEARPRVAAAPSDAAVGGAVHDILASGQTASALIHRRLVNVATALQVAGDLDVADEAAVELDATPGGAVIGVSDVEGAAANVKVVVGDVHPPVMRAGWVVVHPHALAVIRPAAMRAGPCGPSDTVGRGPQADALAAAAGCQVARKPHVQLRVVHHVRVTEVGAVTGAEGLAGVPGGPIIGRVGQAAEAAARSATVVVVDNPGVVRAAP